MIPFAKGGRGPRQLPEPMGGAGKLSSGPRVPLRSGLISRAFTLNGSREPGDLQVHRTCDVPEVALGPSATGLCRSTLPPGERSPQGTEAFFPEGPLRSRPPQGPQGLTHAMPLGCRTCGDSRGWSGPVLPLCPCTRRPRTCLRFTRTWTGRTGPLGKLRSCLGGRRLNACTQRP